MKRKDAGDFIKECIADAFVRLLRDRPLEQISIQEITDCADVGRVTYYRNFNSKEDILFYKLNRTIEAWYRQLDAQIRTDKYLLLVGFLRLILSARELFELLYRNGLSHIVLRSFSAQIGPKREGIGLDLYEKAFLTYGLFGLTDAWIKTGMKQPPEEIGRLLLSQFSAKPQLRTDVNG